MDGGNGFFLLHMGALFGGALGLLGLALALIGHLRRRLVLRQPAHAGDRRAYGSRRTTPGHLRLVVGHGLGLVGGGIVLGLVAAFGISRLMGSLLFGISGTDPLTFLSVPLVLGTMAFVASYLPALRATRIDPMRALRSE